ncbi:hypothetical protein ABZ912_56910 [Nonomuraea angiospora]|uniref:hypothetical protein n=1 Tax=Nonomuraea angiospora TaxID=46172 RepID=UPI0033E6D09A
MALAIGAHTYGISILGRAEVAGASVTTVRGALAASTAAAGLAAVSCLRDRPSSKHAAARASAVLLLAGHHAATVPAQAGLRARPDRKAVWASILGLIPLQAAAIAGSGRLPTAGVLLGALPAGRWLLARMATS